MKIWAKDPKHSHCSTVAGSYSKRDRKTTHYQRTTGLLGIDDEYAKVAKEAKQTGVCEKKKVKEKIIFASGRKKKL